MKIELTKKERKVLKRLLKKKISKMLKNRPKDYIADSFYQEKVFKYMKIFDKLEKK